MFRMVCVLALICAATTASADIRKVRFDFAGQTRSYLLYVPDRPAAGPRPLVLVLHGGGGSAREVRISTKRGYERLADREGFYVVYPDAIGRIWDTGHGEISSRLEPRRDDLGFLKAVIERVSDGVPIDGQRIFATGISRGGQASYMLACETEGLVRAIAPVAMTLPAAQAKACPKQGPVGFLLVMGTEDPIVPYAGGQIEIFGQARDRVLSADATFHAFLRRNGCTGTETLAPKGQVARDAGTGCRAPVQIDRVEGGGHSWPSGRKMLGTGRSGPVSHDISAAEEIWGFFSKF